MSNILLPSIQLLANLFPGYVYWKDRNGLFCGCNDLVASTFGIESAEKIIGLSDEDLLTPELARKVRENDLRVMETGESLQIVEEAVDAQGAPAQYFSYKIPMKDDSGNIVGIMGISVNITEQRNSNFLIKEIENIVHGFDPGAPLLAELYQTMHQQKLNKVLALYQEVTGEKATEPKDVEEYLSLIRDYLESIIAVMPGHAYWKNKEGFFLGCNNAVAKRLGLKSRHDILGKTTFDLYPDEIAQPLVDLDNIILKTGEKYTKEEIDKDLNGNEIVYLSYKVPLFNQKKEVIGLVGISLDITERKQAERLMQKAKDLAEHANQMKSEFILNMGHDIRTPMNAILGGLQVLIAQQKEPEQKEFMEAMLEAGRKLMDLLGELIEFAEVSTHDEDIQSAAFSLHQVIADVGVIINPLLRQHQLQWATEYDTNIPEVLHGLHKKLERVLLNLACNAIKFTPKGEISLKVHLLEDTPDYCIIEFTVSDTGIGIPEEKIPFIFEKFTKLNSSYNTPYKGLGLGLSIVQQFLDSMGGTIRVTSKPGEGSNFICNIPFQKNSLTS